MHVCTVINIVVSLLLATRQEKVRIITLVTPIPQQKNPPCVLIVDDENNVALTLGMVFQQTGCTVVTADGCAAALKILADRRDFDAVITDLCMEEERSGLQVAQAAAQLHPRPVVVMITGFGTFPNVKAAVGSAVDYFALKPLDLDELKRTVARLLAIRQDRLK